MNERNAEERLADIATCCNHVSGYIKHLTQEQFLANAITVDAVSWNLIVIGEASRYITGSYRQELRPIPWDDLVALGDTLLNLEVALPRDLIWATIHDVLPNVRALIEESLSGPTLIE